MGDGGRAASTAGETVARGRSGEHRPALHRAARRRHQQVHLLGLGRGRWRGRRASTSTSGSSAVIASPMVSAEHHRARGGRAASMPANDARAAAPSAAISSLGLEGDHPQVLVPRQLVQDVGRGRNRVAAVEGLSPARAPVTTMARAVLPDVAIGAGLEAGRAHLVADLEQRSVREVVAALQGGRVGSIQCLVLELGLDPPHGGLERAIVEPVHDPEREEILAAVDRLLTLRPAQRRPSRAAGKPGQLTLNTR